jgi:hypothetical protein
MTLVEAAVAVLILTVGVTAVAALFARGMQYMGASQDDLIAKTKAQEAIESVFAARDDQSLTWAQIRNVQGASGSDNGIFRDGPLPINDPGADGLVNTNDDGALQFILLPGPDGLFGTADDVHVPLAKFAREIRIRDVAGTPGLRTVQVIVNYNSNGLQRTFQITTFISQFS